MARAFQKGTLNLIKTGRHKFSRAAAVFFVLLTAWACSSIVERKPSAVFNRGDSIEFFETAYSGIDSYYIEKFDTGELASRSLRSLSNIDEDLTIEFLGNKMALMKGGEHVAIFEFPEDQSVDTWAQFTTDVIESARRYSPETAGLTSEKIYQILIEEALKPFDRFSRYSGRDAANENRASRHGFIGIGIRIKLKDDYPHITMVFEDAPAEKSGLKKGDVIRTVDGNSVEGWNLKQVAQKVRGPVGSSVILTVSRKDRTLSLKVDRDDVIAQTVAYERQGDIAHIRLLGFNRNTAQSLRDKLDQAQEDIGPGMKGIVLDLRENRGGLLDQAVKVSDIFITDGDMLSTRGRHANSQQKYQAYEPDQAEDLPMIVLIDRASASASEVVAAALQDNGRALLIGARSYGKGSVQTVLTLPNDGELTITWAKMFAPSGYALSKYGVFPHLCSRDFNGDIASYLESVNRSDNRPRDILDMRRSIDALPETTVTELLERCDGPSTVDEDDDKDLKLALEIFRQPELYSAAMGSAQLAQTQIKKSN